MMEIVEVKNQQDIKRFHDVQDFIYRNDAIFIKPIIQDVEDTFDRNTNVAYAEGDAVRFLLMDGSNVIGRCAAFYRNKAEGKMGGMGYFECIDNKEAAFKLFDTCRDWLQKQGCTYMDGPVNFGDRDTFWGLLVENSTYPSYRENYQPAYYRAFFEEYGFEKIIEQSTSEITEAEFNFERFSKLASRVMQNEKYQFVILDWSKMNQFAKDFMQIYNEAWSHHEDFKPLTMEAVMKRLKQIKPVLDPNFAIFAYAEGRPIGFYISMLEVNQVFKNFNGKLNLWNKLKFLMNRSKINKVRGIIFGVVPDFQNLGIETGMIMKFHEGYTNSPNIKVAELAWIGDFNGKMLSMLKSLGSYTTKVHYTYRKIF
ncbi:MAG: GNAT family N-acetyltransferase [Bacteroidia bacterium]|nr:GNAT family N-acetyltransferase [Bacteroidia bacterium]